MNFVVADFRSDSRELEVIWGPCFEVVMQSVVPNLLDYFAGSNTARTPSFRWSSVVVPTLRFLVSGAVTIAGWAHQTLKNDECRPR